MIGQQVGRLARGTLTYGIGQTLLRLTSLLLLPLFTRYLTPADYGVSGLLALLAAVVTPVFALGMGTAIGLCYFQGGEIEYRATTIWSAFAILLGAAALLTLIGFTFGREISMLVLRTPAHYSLVALFLFGTALSIIVLPFMLYLQMEERAGLYVLITMLATAISLGAGVIMVVSLRRGVQGLIESTVIGQGATLILFAIPALMRLPIRVNWLVARRLIRLGVPLVPSFAFVFIMQQGNKYALQWFEGLESVGIYSVGYNLGVVMTLIVSGFTTAWTPYFLSFVERRDEARILFGKIMSYYVLGFGTLSLLFYIGARPLVLLMTKPAFHSAYIVVGPVATAQFLVGVFSLLLPGMYFAEEVSFLALLQGVAAVASVALGVVLIPPLGLLGSVIALILGTLVMVLLQVAWNFSRRRDYLVVNYERRRLLWFAICYVCYIVALLWPRHLSFWGELLFSVLTVIPLPIALVSLLTGEEREVLRTMGKQLAQRKGHYIVTES